MKKVVKNFGFSNGIAVILQLQLQDKDPNWKMEVKNVYLKSIEFATKLEYHHWSNIVAVACLVDLFLEHPSSPEFQEYSETLKKNIAMLKIDEEDLQANNDITFALRVLKKVESGQ